MPSRPCPQARGRTRASSWPPSQSALTRRDRRFPECARRRRARSSSPPRSTWTPTISRPARATSRRGSWPRCTTRRSGGARRAVMAGPSWKKPPGRWSNSALSLPTEWSRPRISTDSESWTQGPKSPLHQLSRHYRWLLTKMLCHPSLSLCFSSDHCTCCWGHGHDEF